MLSRVADSIYWMSRYVERVENIGRFIDVTLNIMLDLPVGTPEQWLPLVMATGDHDWFHKKYGEATQQNVIQFLTFDREYSHSILSSLTAARENARSIRETISSEMWEQLNQFYYFVRDAARSGSLPNNPHDFFHEVKMSSHLFEGITDHTMSHNEGWHFRRLGQYVERADKTSRILDVKYFVLLPTAGDVGTPVDDLQWSAVLRSVSGFEMYLKRQHVIHPDRVVEFLLLDREFPRAIRFCVNEAEESLRAISGTAPGKVTNLAEERMGELSTELANASVDVIIRGGLHEFLDSLQTKLNGIGDAVYSTFIALRPEKAEAPAAT